MTYGPPIETLQDWNARLEACGCCEMPVCPVPTMDCERKLFQVAGTSSFSNSSQRWNTRKDTNSWETPAGTFSNAYGGTTGPSYLQHDYSSSGDIVFTWTYSPKYQTFECGITTGKVSSNALSGIHTSTIRINTGYDDSGTLGIFESFYQEITVSPKVGDPTKLVRETHTIERSRVGGVVVVDSDTTVSVELFNVNGLENSHGTRSAETTYEDEMTAAEAQAELVALIAAADLSSCSSTADSQCYSTLSLQDSPGTILATAYVGRHRFEIPDSFTGSYFKISWDYVLFPTGSDPSDPADPDASFVSQNHTWVWSGPGTPLDEATWQSPWFQIPTPSEAGRVEVRNIRFECYRSPLGSAPQVTGSAWSPAA